MRSDSIRATTGVSAGSEGSVRARCALACAIATSRVGSVEPGALPPPIVDIPSITARRACRPRPGARRVPSPRARSTRRVSAIMRGTGIVSAARPASVLAERRLERRHRSSCRRASRASADGAGSVDDLLARADEDAGLRPAEQLVAAEQHEVCAGDHAGAHVRLVAQRRMSGPNPRYPLPRSSTTGRWNVAPERDELGSSGRSVNPVDPEVRRMDAQDHPGPIGDRRRVVVDPRAVRRPDLAQDGLPTAPGRRGRGSRRRSRPARRARR